MSTYIFETIEHGVKCPVNVFVTSIGISSFHWHYDYEIIFVLKGSIIVNMHPEPFALTEGNYIMINSKQVHELKKAEEDNICLFIQLNQNMFRSKARKGQDYYFYLNSCHKDKIPQNGYKPFAANMARIGLISLKPDESNIYRFQSFVYALLADLFDYTLFDIRQRPQGQQEKNINLLMSIIEYIQSNFKDEYVLNNLYQELEMSEKSTYRYLKENTGISPRELVLDKRIEESKYLLRSTDKPILFIVDECGFGGENTFYRVFKKKVGVTPLEYRKKGVRNEIRPGVKGYLQFNKWEAEKKLKNFLKE